MSVDGHIHDEVEATENVGHGGDGGHGADHGPRDVLTISEDPDTAYMYRPGQLIVKESDLGLAWRELTLHRAQEIEVDERLGIRIFRVSDDAVPQVVRRIRASVAPRVSPNVALTLGWHTFCAGSPRPIKAPDEFPLTLPEPTTDYRARVAVLDTGVVDDEWFGDRIEKRGPQDDDVLERDKDGTVFHGFGHGTFAASRVARHGPDSKLVVRRIAAKDGVTDDLTLARALLALCDQQEEEKVDVVSLSVSAYTPGDTGLVASEEALRQLFEMNRDLVVVVAAGNHGNRRWPAPASYKRVVSVGALDRHGHRAYFSNFGPWVDACTEGVDVEGIFPKVKNVRWPHEAEAKDYSCGLATWSGTSFAAPKVAGVLAQKMSGPNRVTGRQAVYDLILDGPEAVTELGTRIR